MKPWESCSILRKEVALAEGRTLIRSHSLLGDDGELPWLHSLLCKLPRCVTRRDTAAEDDVLEVLLRRHGSRRGSNTRALLRRIELVTSQPTLT
uniref:GSVIVT00021644001 n=1 Tax=Arundo donax TaxID=35708 RepID=A0A0A9E9Z2_ARUDO